MNLTHGELQNKNPIKNILRKKHDRLIFLINIVSKKSLNKILVKHTQW